MSANASAVSQWSVPLVSQIGSRPLCVRNGRSGSGGRLVAPTTTASSSPSPVSNHGRCNSTRSRPPRRRWKPSSPRAIGGRSQAKAGTVDSTTGGCGRAVLRTLTGARTVWATNAASLSAASKRCRKRLIARSV